MAEIGRAPEHFADLALDEEKIQQIEDAMVRAASISCWCWSACGKPRPCPRHLPVRFRVMRIFRLRAAGDMMPTCRCATFRLRLLGLTQQTRLRKTFGVMCLGYLVRFADPMPLQTSHRWYQAKSFLARRVQSTRRDRKKKEGWEPLTESHEFRLAPWVPYGPAMTETCQRRSADLPSAPGTVFWRCGRRGCGTRRRSSAQSG